MSHKLRPMQPPVAIVTVRCNNPPFSNTFSDIMNKGEEEFNWVWHNTNKEALRICTMAGIDVTREPVKSLIPAIVYVVMTQMRKDGEWQ